MAVDTRNAYLQFHQLGDVFDIEKDLMQVLNMMFNIMVMERHICIVEYASVAPAMSGSCRDYICMHTQLSGYC